MLLAFLKVRVIFLYNFYHESDRLFLFYGFIESISMLWFRVCFSLQIVKYNTWYWINLICIKLILTLMQWIKYNIHLYIYIYIYIYVYTSFQKLTIWKCILNIYRYTFSFIIRKVLTEQIKGTFVQEKSTGAAVKIPKSLFQLNTIF